MSVAYDTTPKEVERVSTKFRRIQTPIPAPETLGVLDKLRRFEPVSMTGQPPVVWNKAEGFQIHDPCGNMWLDFCSGVLVANVGHCHPKVQRAIIEQAYGGLLHNYCFPSAIRAELVEKLASMAPPGLDKVFLLTTGSESTENAIKLVRTYGLRGGKNGGKGSGTSGDSGSRDPGANSRAAGGCGTGDRRANGKAAGDLDDVASAGANANANTNANTKSCTKVKILSFEGAFHGRTLGAQLIGGIPALKEWIVNHDPDIVQAPFPNCFRCPRGKAGFEPSCQDECFNGFLRDVEAKGIEPENLAGVITETFQGGAAAFFPDGFVPRLARFCRDHDILLIFDEIQAGFGRTGKLFGFEHYGIVPDIICLGKGMTSSLPLSAVIGRTDVMDMYGPNEMTSTHTGNPVCVAAALASIQVMEEERLVDNARKAGEILETELEKLRGEFRGRLEAVTGRGLVYALHVVRDGTREPDGYLAHAVVGRAYERGLMLFAPVGLGGGSIKLCPPLNITQDAVRDGVQALREAVGLALG